MDTVNRPRCWLLASGALACALLLALPWPAGAAQRLQVGSIRVGSKAAPLTISVQTNRNAELKMRVNGSSVREAFEYKGRRIQVAHLSGADGLVPGKNRIRIRGESPRWSASTRVTARIPRAALFADAGKDLGATAAAPATLGAPPSGPTATPGLRYAWRIVDAPGGANASLAHRHEARPVLNASTPGTYRLGLKVRRAGRPVVSHDTLTVPVSPDDPPIGAPLNTMSSNTARPGAITIGDDSYGGGFDLSQIAYVVLERTTRAPAVDDAGKPVAGNVSADAAGLAQLTKIASKYGSGTNYLNYLMIVSARSGVSASNAADLGQFVKTIGANPLTAAQFGALRDGFSIIGIPGAQPGAATLNFPGTASAPAGAAITGYLAKNQAVNEYGTPLYDFVSPDHPAFDTSAAGSEDRENVMTVGPARYEARMDPSIPGASAGLHVVILDGQTLRLLDNRILVTNAERGRRAARRATDSRDNHLQAIAADFLRDQLAKPGDPLVLVQSVGKVKAAGPAWSGIVDQLTRLGANRQLVNALDGTHTYALVGRLNSDQPPGEASDAYDPKLQPLRGYPPARLVGVLVRDRTYSYAPTVYSTPTPSNPAGTVNLGLTKVAYQQPQQWPKFTGTKAVAAQYICTQVGFCKDASDSCPDMRSCYWQQYTSADWDKKSDRVGNVAYPGESAGVGSELSFNAVRQELFDESSAVAEVKSYLKQLQEPFTSNVPEILFNLQAIGDQVYKALQTPQSTSTSWALGLVQKALLLGNFAPPPASSGASGLSAIFGLAAYLSNKQGQPILGSEVKAKTSELAQQLFDRYQTAQREMEGIGKIIVSDYGKLMSAQAHIDTDWKVDGMAPASTALRRGAEQSFYEALLPTAYPYLIRGNASNARSFDCRHSTQQAWPNEPDSAQMRATVGYDSNGNPIQNVFFFTRGIYGGSSPPESLSHDLFRPINDPDEPKNPGKGMQKVLFLTPSVFGHQILHAVNGTQECSLGWLPQFP